MSNIILSDQTTDLQVPGKRHISPVDIYLARLRSAASKATMETYLIRIVEIVRGQPFKIGRRYSPGEKAEAQATVRTFPWHSLDYDMVMAIRAKLVEQYQPRTVNGQLVALRQVLGICYRQGLIERERYETMMSKEGLTQEPVDSGHLAGREIKQRELSQLKQVCLQDNSTAGIRDAALLGTLYAAKLRRFEAAKVQIADYDPETGNLTITGKRNKTRTDRVSASVRELLADWLKARGDLPGPLFAPVNKGGNITRRGDGTPAGMTAQAIYNMLKKRAKEAGIDPASLSPHDFRRTAITNQIRAGVPLAYVQKLAGHSSPTTTARYDRSSLEEALAFADTLEF